MSDLDAGQLAQISRYLEQAVKLAEDRSKAAAEKIVDAAILAERERLAHIVETCEPFSDFAQDDPLHTKDEVEELGATLAALGRAIRTGHHE
jgi:hypothetical protein